jgi:hypothetical protein
MKEIKITLTNAEYDKLNKNLKKRLSIHLLKVSGYIGDFSDVETNEDYINILIKSFIKEL